MKTKNLLLLCVVSVLCAVSCRKQPWTVTAWSSVSIAMDSTVAPLADRAYEARLAPLREEMDARMNVVIGRTAQAMRAGQPESLLSNFTADVFRRVASDRLGEPVDIALVNMGGLRTDLPAGDITVGRVFELMPFENELVILRLRGDRLLALLDVIASVGGEGVSGLRMGIGSDGRAVSPTVGGRTVDPGRLYLIATNDYLAGGNDRMVQLAEHDERVNTGVKVRNMLIDYIRAETAAGRTIQSRLDGRIYEAN